MFNALRACTRRSIPAASSRLAFAVPALRPCAGQARSYSDNVTPEVQTDSLQPEYTGPPQPGADAYPPPAVPAVSPKSKSSGAPAPHNDASNHTRLRLHCHSSPNNTIVTLTKENGSTIAWFSGGSCGFKKGNRATYEAGYQCAVRSFKKIEEIHEAGEPVAVDLFFKGFGEGRNALKAALLATEGENIRGLVYTVTDRTPIKIGGTRAKKMPRL